MTTECIWSALWRRQWKEHTWPWRKKNGRTISCTGNVLPWNIIITHQYSKMINNIEQLKMIYYSNTQSWEKLVLRNTALIFNWDFLSNSHEIGFTLCKTLTQSIDQLTDWSIHQPTDWPTNHPAIQANSIQLSLNRYTLAMVTQNAR